MKRVKFLPNGCWEWTKAKNAWGHGVYTFLGKHSTVIRTLFQHTYNVELENNQILRPSCRTYGCCNPEHFVLSEIKTIVKREKKEPSPQKPTERIQAFGVYF